MENLRIVLRGLDLGFEDIVMTRIYLTRFRQDYAEMNETYRSYFPSDRLPARTCVGVTGLAYDALVEIDLVCRRRLNVTAPPEYQRATVQVCRD